jgi:pSer/pThr/pTyr-binding forkhead associated (FHA) protein
MPIRVTARQKFVYLTDRDLIIGRGEAADLRIDDPSLSRVHASLGLENGRVRITDLASSNGTRVNGTPVVGSRVVRLDDHIEVGDITVMLELVTGDAAAAQPRPDDDTIGDQLAEENEPRTVLRASFRVPGAGTGSRGSGSGSG